MEISYSKVGDYLIPNLILPEEEQSIGKYGRMRRRYLKEHRPVLFSNLVLSGKLYDHLAEIDRACETRLELIIHQLKTQEGAYRDLTGEVENYIRKLKDQAKYEYYGDIIAEAQKSAVKAEDEIQKLSKAIDAYGGTEKAL